MIFYGFCSNFSLNFVQKKLNETAAQGYNMRINHVFFDLDGTLLPMDQDEFVKAYLGLLGKRLAPKGYEFEKFIKVMWAGVGSNGKTWDESLFINGLSD